MGIWLFIKTTNNLDLQRLSERSSFTVKFRIAKRHPSYWEDDIVYSPNKYRETEGIKVCKNFVQTRTTRLGRRPYKKIH